jgi:hypothetical protein
MISCEAHGARNPRIAAIDDMIRRDLPTRAATRSGPCAPERARRNGAHGRRVTNHVRLLLVAVAAIAIPHAVRADDGPRRKVCQLPLRDEVSPGCRTVDTVRTPWGKVTLFTAYDTRGEKLTPAVIRRGDYLALYSLVFAGREEPETFEDGGQPTGHPYEACGSDSHWCERIVSSTPRLSVDRTGTVTLLVKTIARVQRWVDVGHNAHRIEVTRHTRVLTVRCEHDATAGWGCTSAP